MNKFDWREYRVSIEKKVLFFDLNFYVLEIIKYLIETQRWMYQTIANEEKEEEKEELNIDNN